MPGIQINRFCASGLDAVNLAAAQVMSGQKDLVVGGGVESMSRVGMGASGFGIAMDPSVAIDSYFTPQGVAADLIATKYGFNRAMMSMPVAVESSHKRAAAGLGRWPLRQIGDAGEGRQRPHHPGQGRDDPPNTDMQTHWAGSRPPSPMMGETGRLRRRGHSAAHPEVEAINHVHHAGNSSGIVDGASAVLIGIEGGRSQGGHQAARPHPWPLPRSARISA